MTHAGIERPARREGPRRLQVLVDVADVVVFVAPKRALHAQHAIADRAREILEAAPAFVEAIGRETGDERQRLPGKLHAVRVAHIGTQIVSFAIDHAAGAGDGRLRRDRDRLELLRGSRSAVHQNAQPAAAIELVFDDRAGLRLREALARIELKRRRIDASWIAFELVAREAERILRAREIDRIGDQREGRLRIEPERELRVAELAPRRTVFARPVGFENGWSSRHSRIAMTSRAMGPRASLWP